MAMSPSLSLADKLALVKSLEGTEIARCVSIAAFGLTVYEYFITLDDEIKYFWTGSWTASRILFLFNRYLPPCIMITDSWSLVSQFRTLRQNCKSAIQAAFLLNILAVCIIQGILVTRVWYLFQGSRTIQLSVILGFLISIASSLVFLYLSANNIRIIQAEILSAFPGIRYEGCRAARPPNFWRIYVPSLVLHTFLYILTAVRALRNRRLLKDAPVLKRLLRDGGFFYFIVFVSVGYTAIGSFLTKVPWINIPAIYSHLLLTTTSLAVSRVMFSIHSLAAKLGSDSAWLLNNVELSRVGWRQGAHEGELIIERDTVYSDKENDIESSDGHSTLVGGSVDSLKYTRVGIFNDRSW